MPLVVGVSFKRMDKIYHFDPAGLELVPGDHVIVETSKGIECGQVTSPPVEVVENKIVQPLKPVVRKADDKDIARLKSLKIREEEAFMLAYEKIEDRRLQMKLIDVKFSFDEDRVGFYFSAEQRIDFRDLVRELSRDLNVRVEMRQIGARDEARMIGGYGTCGESLCCTKFNSAGSPITIKMAKDQDLPLNPEKISGCCSRLMCCIRYEHEVYQGFKKESPRKGSNIRTSRGDAVVLGHNVPAGKILVQLSDNMRCEISPEEIISER